MNKYKDLYGCRVTKPQPKCKASEDSVVTVCAQTYLLYSDPLNRFKRFRQTLHSAKTQFNHMVKSPATPAWF